MSIVEQESVAGERRPSWKWLVCGLLLLATMLNYMDRLTLNLTAVEIKSEMGLSNTKYGEIEWVFGIGFAGGALFMGWSADRWNVRWLYPMAVLAWSAAGFATGFASSFFLLLVCRFVLGAAEAGNWPFALRTTQHILPPGQRTMGNSILQSGAAIGAILTPQVVQLLVDHPSDWRKPFFAIGALGTVWVFLWLYGVRRPDLPTPATFAAAAAGEARESLLAICLQRRFFVLLVLVIVINLTWHFFRVWLPLYLRENLLYSKTTANNFMSCYYVATDVGALLAGFLTLFLVRREASVHRSRLLVFLGATLLTGLSLSIPFLGTQVVEQRVHSPIPLVRGPERAVTGPGWILLGTLLLIGVGALALYPVYYSLSQELTFRNQGKLTGILGFSTWTFTAAMHPLVGRWLDWTKEHHGMADYQSGMAVAGVLPLAGLLVLAVFWNDPLSKPVQGQA